MCANFIYIAKRYIIDGNNDMAKPKQIKPKKVAKMTPAEKLDVIVNASMETLAAINKDNTWLQQLAVNDPSVFAKIMLQSMKMQMDQQLTALKVAQMEKELKSSTIPGDDEEDGIKVTIEFVEAPQEVVYTKEGQ